MPLEVSEPQVGPAAWSDGSARVWEKTVRDQANDSFSKARDIGKVRLDYSRLNVVSEISVDDDEADYFYFDTQSNGGLRLSNVESGDDDEAEDAPAKIRLQLYTLDQWGREKIIADSGAEEGTELFENSELLVTGDLKVKKDTRFAIKVTKTEDAPSDEAVQYMLQVQMGTDHEHDYLTTEAEAKPVDPATEAMNSLYQLPTLAETALANVSSAPSGSLMAAQSANSLLVTGMSNMSAATSGAVSMLDGARTGSSIDLFS